MFKLLFTRRIELIVDIIWCVKVPLKYFDMLLFMNSSSYLFHWRSSIYIAKALWGKSGFLLCIILGIITIMFNMLASDYLMLPCMILH